ncbi:type II toxin-antitoxin system RelE/ParE family toxin [Roseateles sp.]|uniref:type II toxin-antitoxin system RelE/ParE family toxin n=1 Tax=Roseateles sp. TaxID=1971397 RepID=UPI003267B5D8
MSFVVQLTDGAEDDLQRLLDHLIDRAEFVEDLIKASQTMQELRESMRDLLTRHPMIFRKAAGSPFLRELIVPLGARGYVVLFEVIDAQTVRVLALRHQREDDYH